MQLKLHTAMDHSKLTKEAFFSLSTRPNVGENNGGKV